MKTSNTNEGMRETAHLPEATTNYLNNKKRRITILIIIGIVAAIGLYFLSSYWHPFWRYQPGYVSEAQFKEDWPFTVSEAKVVCLGSGEMILTTRAGIFGLTSHAIAIGYKSLEDANIWKWDPSGWHNHVPADEFWIYVNTLCK
jgi:hypothetical protein